MSEEIIYPVESSKSGKNAFYHHCDHRGQSASYAVCLHTLDAIDEGRIKEDQFTDCQAACKTGMCEARRMRRKELDAGHALYFKERTNINPANKRSEKEAQEQALCASSGKYDLTNPSFARGWNQVGSTKSSEPSIPKQPRKPVSVAVPKPVEKPSGYIEQDFAKLVNTVASEKPTEKPAVLVEPEVTPTKPVFDDKPLPGETPLQFARRRAAAMKG